MNHDFQDNSRSQYRSKRKKTNRILNSLIIIVLLLIAVVAYSIFSSGNNKTASKKSEPKTAKVDSAQTKNTNQKEKSSDSKNLDETSATQDSNTANSTADLNGADNSNAVVTQGGSSPNVNQTIENPDWKPVGTSQTGQHSTVYDSNSADWQEMLKAISYATGLDQSNMTVWFLGRDRSTADGSVGTVSSKDKQQKYRVYIQWVDGQGWKPTKVEKLSQIS